MDVTWHGDACFRVRNRDNNILIDPFDTAGTPTRGLGDASIVLVSDDRPTDGLALTGRVIQGPGEYEIGGVLITGVRTSRSARRGAEATRTISYIIEMDEVRLCALGRLDRVLTTDLVGDLNGVDVLIVPVGGHGVLDAAAAAEVISMLEPRIVIPMLYRSETSDSEMDSVDRFLKQMGLSETPPIARLSATRTNLPVETAVTLLDYRKN